MGNVRIDNGSAGSAVGNGSAGSAVGGQPGVSLAPLVGSLVLRRLTGVLRLTLAWRETAVYFQSGDIVDADPGSPEDTLGRVALEAGLVDDQAVGESLRRMARAPERSETDILVEMGALRGDALERALRMTLTRRAVRIFDLPGATVRVDETAHGRLEGGPVEPRWVVHRGLRRFYDEQRLALETRSLAGSAIRLTADPGGISAAFGFSRDELVVVRYLAKTHHWELPDLVDCCQKVDRSTLLAVVHALHAFEQLDVKPRGAVHRYRRTTSKPTVPVPPVQGEAAAAAAVDSLRRGPAGTLPPLGAPPRLPLASQAIHPVTPGSSPAAWSRGAPAPVDRGAESTTPLAPARAMTESAYEHFRNGEAALRREDYTAAIAKFRSAVDLDGSHPEYHAYLAWSRWCDARSKDVVFPEVRGGLVKAIRLSGNRCVPAFYFHGLVHDARGDHEKAYKSFQIVLSLDEGHVDAARRMHLIERRKQTGPRGLLDRLRGK
jgi:hypothetical protein